MQEARFATADLEAEDTGVSHLRVKPGKRQGFAHKHDEAEEVYVVVAGSGPREARRRHPRDHGARRDPGLARVIRQFEAGSEGIELIAFGARHDGDGELLPGWWSD